MSEFYLSRVTLISFLLAGMVGLGLWSWNIGHKDACAAYLAGDKTAPATMYVVTGTRTVVVRCDDWLARVPLRVQMVVFVEVVVGAVFLMNLLGDVKGWRERRVRMRGGTSQG